MVTIYAAMGNALAVIRCNHGNWKVDLKLGGFPTQCVAADPMRPDLVYCGTFGHGLWKSDDAGENWQPVGEGIAHPEVMAVAVSRVERVGNRGVVWAGTEPSALFRSADGGATWLERPNLKTLPSAPTWSFPPRPWTHHVRWILPDPVVAQRIFVGIELGGVMRSLDDGQTWEDRKPGAQPDAHTLRAHRLAPGRVYEAAGGGFAESFDGGTTWRGFDDGLRWHYLWGLAIDPGDPDTVVVSASPGPRQAHDAMAGQVEARRDASQHDPTLDTGASVYRSSGGPRRWSGHGQMGPESAVYRRSGNGPWMEVRSGLPEPRGTLAYVLASNEDEPGVFYAAPHQGSLFRSVDAGLSWERLNVVWPDGLAPRRAEGLVVVGQP